MDRRWLALVVIGGMAGATTRWAVFELAPPTGGFPWATFAVNIVGCALLGVLTAVVRARPRHRAVAGDLLGVGFCGGLTTMSTLAVELAAFGRNDRVGLAAVYLATSLAAGVLAAWIGVQAGRHLHDAAR